MSDPWLRADAKNGSVRLLIHVQPRASRNEFAGLYGGALKVRIMAPPIEGAANAALIEFLADWLGVTRRAIRIATGQHGRSKLVEIAGIDEQHVRRLVAGAATR
ncbi:MAG TPA: DUF167 domain-containing protein [Gemmatimonadaceae bacterium]|nr:DUF167 domain-containing protein [Gemmatimonadaceae bacterium]